MSILKGVAERAGANGTTFGEQEADNYSIIQFCKITPYLTMNPALEFRNPSVYPKTGVTTILKSAVSWSCSARAPRVGPEFRSRRLVRRTLSLV